MSEATPLYVNGTTTTFGKAEWTAAGPLFEPSAYETLSVPGPRRMEFTLLTFVVTPEQGRAYQRLSPAARQVVAVHWQAILDAAVQAEPSSGGHNGR